MFGSRPYTNEQSTSRRTERVKIHDKDKKFVHVGSYDHCITLVVAILVLIGIVMVFSATYATTANYAHYRYDPFYYLKRNAFMAALGILFMLIASRVNFRLLQKFAYAFYAFSAFLLVIVMIYGATRGGATRWIEIPGTPFSFQPSEFAKVATIFALAKLIHSKPNILHSKGGFVLTCLIVGFMVGLVLQGGLSSALIVAATGFGMVFVASPHIWRFILTGILGFVGFGAYMFFGAGFRMARVNAWINPFDYQLDAGFQVINSLYAIASGGIFGLGVGRSRQATFIPEAHNDIIFSIIVEELGLMGGGLVMLLFGVLIWRGVRIAMMTEDTFSSMVAMGVVFAIGFQAIINIAVVTNTIPNTGVTLPFISYGGTSLLVSMGLAGVLLNLSRYVNE